MQTVQYETTPRGAKPIDHQIEIVDSQSVQNRPFKVIGLAQANAGKFHSPTDTVNRLKAQARRLGGDALLFAPGSRLNIRHSGVQRCLAIEGG